MSGCTDFASMLHVLRRRRNLTLGELARRTGIPVRRLAEFEYDDRPLLPAEREALVAALEIDECTFASGMSLAGERAKTRPSRQRPRRARWIAVAAAVAALSFGNSPSAYASTIEPGRVGSAISGKASLANCEPSEATDQPAVVTEELQRRVVASSKLNLRAGPGVGYCIAHMLEQGTEVILQNEDQVVGKSVWVRVLADEHEGWVNGRHLEEKRSVVTSPGLNLRHGPGVANEVMRVLTGGTEVVLRFGSQEIGKSRWIKVLAEQYEGWVNRRYLADDLLAASATEEKVQQVLQESVTEAQSAGAELPVAVSVEESSPGPTGAPGTEGVYGCPVVSPQGLPVIMTQGYGVGTHAPPELWGAIDLAPAGGPATAQGAIVVAVHSGTVGVALDTWPGGNHVSVHGAEGWRTGYSHLQAVYVETGQYVEAGQPLGVMGSTGHSSGPHLDFQVWHNGINLDPTDMVDCR